MTALKRQKKKLSPAVGVDQPRPVLGQRTKHLDCCWVELLGVRA